MERSPEYTASRAITKLHFFFVFALLHTSIYLLHVPNQLLDAVYLDAATVTQQLHFKHPPVTDMNRRSAWV